MSNATPLRVGMVIDEVWYAPFFVELAGLLESTGQVAPVLAICLDKTPDPDSPYPWVRLRERTEAQPRHDYDWDDLTGYEQFLREVDPYFEGRHRLAARALCAEAEAWFARENLDALLVWSGTRLAPRSVAAAARACGVPLVSLETPYFQKLPDSEGKEREITLNHMKNRVLIWDTVQAPQCGPSQLTRDWPKAAIRPGLNEFLEGLRKARVSKFSRDDIENFRKDGQDFALKPPSQEITLFKPPETRALLVCGQVDRDSSMFYFNHLVRNWYDLGVELAKRLPEGWMMWFKGHPLDRRYADNEDSFAEELLAINPKCKVLPATTDIHACYAACGAMACINSTAGIEAMNHGLPVINLGQASYTHAGMTYSLQDLDEVEETIAALPETMTGEQCALRDQFLSYVLYEYLIPVGAPERAVARIRQAIAEQRRS